MSLKLYGIPNCGSVKKAKTWLSEQKIDFEFHDFKKQGLSEAQAKTWLAQQAWSKLINRSGLTWRNLSEVEKATVTDNTSALVLMLEKHSVIKRPILERDGVILCLGFDEATYQTLLG